MESSNPILSRSTALESSPGGILQREIQVLGAGTIYGVGEGIGLSLADVADFGGRLREKPVSTITGFVQDHWSEAAVAAGIAVLAPRKHLHWLLLAASGRGVLMSAFEGIVGAADVTQPIGDVRKRFASQLAGETRTLINSLPMTIAGGAAGRTFANATFGRGLGALDLANGKVSWGEIKSNLWNVRDKFCPPMARLAVVDLDGTLVSTSRHLSLGIEKGTQFLSRSTGLSEEIVSELMGEQFGKLKSFTNPWTVELALAERMKVGKPQGMSYEQFRSAVSDPYWRIFDDSFAENLRVYDGVTKTLPALQNGGVQVILLTNSPASAAIPRLRGTGLESRVNLAVMLDSPQPPAGLAPELLRHGAERLSTSLGSENPSFISINRSLAKPGTQFLLQTLAERKLRPSQVMVIGDSLESDMGLAARSGARGLWARWSTMDVEYDALLHRVSRGNFPAGKNSGLPFEVDLNSPLEILNHLRPPRAIREVLRTSAAPPHWLISLESYGWAKRDLK